MTRTSLANDCRQWVAGLYRLATQRQRAQLRQELISQNNLPIAILFYHRVADSHPTPWTISRKNFAQHLDWLERNFDIVSLERAQELTRSPGNSRPAVAITFDDGYGENCDFAIPELQRRGLPATYFVATEAILTGSAFTHDVQSKRPLRPNTPAEIRDIARAGFDIGGHTKNHVDLGTFDSRASIAEEILGGIEQLEAWDAGPIKYFSFPYGLPRNTSQLAVDVLIEAGLAGFCTAYGAWNWPGSAGYHLRRIHADPGMQTLKNWLTLDPRKLHERQALPFIEPDWQPQATVSTCSELTVV